MIVCSCNVLSDHDVRQAVNFADNSPRNTKDIYGCLGCSVECGRCARTIRGLIDETLAACGSSSWKSLGSPMRAREGQKKLVDSEVGPRTIVELEADSDKTLLALLERQTNRPETVSCHNLAAE
jgi:bacterioferritin-associated ferredoxin